MSQFKKGDNSVTADPDRQIMPVLTGNQFHSRAANFAVHTI
jgi:hypothetical protein